MEVEAELTDEGIEDISSDEELYARGDHMSEDIEDDESGESDEEMVEVAPTAGLLAGDIRPIRSRADSSVSAASHVSEGAPTPAFSDRRPSVMGNTRRYEGIKQMSIPRDQAPGKRVDSRHASMVENSDRDDEDEAMSCGVDEHSDEDHGVGAGSGGEDDGDGVLDEDEEEVDGEVDDGALDDDEHDEDWR